MKNIFFSISISLFGAMFCYGAKNNTCESVAYLNTSNNLNLFVEPTRLSNPEEVIYYDDFTTDKRYTTGKESVGSYHYGYFELSVAGGNIGMLSLNKVIDQKKNFQIEAAIKLIDVSDFTNGIIWGKMNDGWDNCFSFGIDKKGQYSIGGRLNNEWNSWIKSLTQSVYINLLDYNKLTIRKIGHTYYFFINDKQVHSCPFVTFYGNENCLFTSNNSTDRISKTNISYLNTSSNEGDGSGPENNTINTAHLSISNPISASLSEYNYNEIPAGVQLVRSESEWLKLSPEKACCCYPEFNDENKSLGLLYNFKAYEKIIFLLNANNSGMKVCTKEQWNDLIAECNSDRNNINTLQLNSYPGYYDEVWYSPKELFTGYWLDENALVSFANETYGQPMIDDNVINDESQDSYRQSLAAFSIRLSKSENNLCGEQKWLNEPVLERGKGNSIKFISNASEWDKQTELIACCAYIDFDFSNDKYGLVYNKLAYDQLLADKDEVLKNQGYRVATEKDWQALITCCTQKGSLANLYNCEGDNYDGFNLEPNGFYGDTGWTLPEFGMSYFWVGEKGAATIYRFECETKSGYYSTNGRRKNGFMIRLVKIVP